MLQINNTNKTNKEFIHLSSQILLLKDHLPNLLINLDNQFFQSQINCGLSKDQATALEILHIWKDNSETYVNQKEIFNQYAMNNPSFYSEFTQLKNTKEQINKKLNELLLEKNALETENNPNQQNLQSSAAYTKIIDKQNEINNEFTNAYNLYEQKFTEPLLEQFKEESLYEKVKKLKEEHEN